MKNDIKARLRNYRKVLALKREYELRIKEKTDDIGLTGIAGGEKTGQTYKITSQTENQAIALAEAKEKLEKLIEEKKIEIERLENAR